MKRVLVFLGLVGAAIYMFGPARTAPQDQVELALSTPADSGPLRTSWGFTLQSLRQQPAAPRYIASPRSSPAATEPDRLLVLGAPDGDTIEWARATLAAYRERSKPTDPPEASPEMWVIGQTNGWVHRDDADDPRRLPSYEYVAAIDHLSLAQDAAEESPPAQAAPKTRAVAVAAVAEEASPIVKPVAYAHEEIEVAGPYRPRGLFVRHVRSDDAPRGRGLFGLFGARKTPELSLGPAG